MFEAIIKRGTLMTVIILIISVCITLIAIYWDRYNTRRE